jgi:soluble lytic murein transglycosylase-like protein
MNKTLRNIGLAALISFNVAKAPPRPEATYYIIPDIYGKNMTEKFEDKVPEEKIYQMIDFSSYVLGTPDYADRIYQRVIVKAESGDDPNATSPVGAKGLRQNMPIAWKEVGATNYDKLAYNPQASITVGIKYTNHLDKFLSRYHPKWDELTAKEKRELNSAAYNGGPSRLRSLGWDINKMPSETKKYVKTINQLYEEYSKKN